MKHSANLLAPLVAGLMALAAPEVGAATPALTLSSVGATFPTDGKFTLGFEFMVSEAVEVVSLGVFDGGAPGLAAPAQVSLWLDDQVGTLLATTEVAAGTGATLVGQFRHAAISPLTLLPGHIYVIGAYLPAGEATAFNMGGDSSVGSFDGRLTHVVDRYWDDGQDFPLGSSGVAGSAWLGANFQIAAVPEPAQAGLLTLGLLGLALRRRQQMSAGTSTVQSASGSIALR